MQQLTGMDAMFLYGETDKSPMHIGPVLIYDPSTAPGGFVRFKDILRTFEERMHRSPVFTRKLMNVPLGLDHPFWVDAPDTDIEFHVRHIALPKPGDWRQFCIQIARLHARVLDRAHPLWEAYVIEGLDNIEGLPAGSFAMFLKVHHAAMDGATGVQIMSALHDFEPVARVEPPPKARRMSPLPSEMQLLAKVTGTVLRQPLEIARILGEAVPVWRRVQAGMKEKRFRSLGQKQRTRFNARVSAHRVFGARAFELATVNAIRKSVPGATVNDVMLTIVAGAMRSYLADKKELPEKSLVVGAPVNVRSEEEKSSGGNVVSMMSIALRTDVADPLERLEKVHREASESKAYLNAVGARTLTDWSNRMPAQVTALGFRAASSTGLMSATRPVFNTILTNVPGPQVPLYMAGARVVRSFGAGPCMDGNGLFQVVTSYAGQIAISFQACRDMMPDPQFYEDALGKAFEDLRMACLARSAPAAEEPRKAGRGRSSAAKQGAAKKAARGRKRATPGATGGKATKKSVASKPSKKAAARRSVKKATTPGSGKKPAARPAAKQATTRGSAKKTRARNTASTGGKPASRRRNPAKAPR